MHSAFLLRVVILEIGGLLQITASLIKAIAGTIAESLGLIEALAGIFKDEVLIGIVTFLGAIIDFLSSLSLFLSVFKGIEGVVNDRFTIPPDVEGVARC
jgi:hypothetical protein